DLTATTADPEHAAVLDHVAGCAACTADLQALRDVRATLRALPAVPMPADVAERLDAALRAAQSPTGNIVPLPKRTKLPGTSSQPWWRTMPYGAAASIVVVLALVVAGVIGLRHSGSESKKSATSAAVAAPSSAAAIGAATVESGTNYTAAQLLSQVAAVVTSNVPGAAAQFPGLTSIESISAPAAAAAPAASAAAAAAGTASASAAASAPAVTFAAASSGAPAFSAPAPVAAGAQQNAAAITAPGGPLADPTALAACIATLAGKPEQAVLVDFATFNGAPSTIIVLPDPDIANKLDIYVEADTQNCANQEFTYAAFLPASPGP
ncbi:MAG TPA: hypothetical protein VK662_08270, partial [Acidothermaceae bacterium]|nr:hypothetical protein [Acidothermaceae bacterium]